METYIKYNFIEMYVLYSPDLTLYPFENGFIHLYINYCNKVFMYYPSYVSKFLKICIGLRKNGACLTLGA